MLASWAFQMRRSRTRRLSAAYLQHRRPPASEGLVEEDAAAAENVDEDGHKDHERQRQGHRVNTL